MNRARLHTATYRFFLSIAYVLATLQWLWILALGLPLLIDAGTLDGLMPPEQVQQPVQQTSPDSLSPAFAIFAGIITLLFLVITVIILIKLPRTIAKTSDAVIHQASEAIVPVVTQHHKISTKKKRVLSRRITISLQLLLITVPFVIAFFIPPVQTITSQIITTLAMWLAGISLLCFVVSWLLEPTPTSQTRSRVSRG